MEYGGQAFTLVWFDIEDRDRVTNQTTVNQIQNKLIALPHIMIFMVIDNDNIPHFKGKVDICEYLSTKNVNYFSTIPWAELSL